MGSGDKAHPRLTSTWWTGKSFLDQAGRVDGQLAFFWRVPDAGALPPHVRQGDTAAVTIQLEDRSVEICLHAVVRERRVAADECGLLLVCVPEEQSRQALVMRCARGERVEYSQRRSERVPCFLPVKVSIADGPPFDSWALNISHHGIFVGHEGGAAPDARVGLVIQFPDANAPFPIKARVRAIVSESIQPGLGLEFIFTSAEQRQNVIDHVARLKQVSEGAVLNLLDDFE